MPKIDGSQGVQPQSSIERNVSGQLGGRQVRTGQSDLPRLDRIRGSSPPKGNFLTRRFEDVTTKMDRTSRSVDQHTEKLLNTLDRPAGKALNGKVLLNQIATLRNHYAQMSQLSGREIDPNATLQLAVAGRLGGMDNEKLINVYRSFLSEDLTAVRSALEAETLRNPGNVAAKHSLEDLGIVEAMLLMEVSGRVARGGGKDVQPLQDRLVQPRDPEKPALSKEAWSLNEHAHLLSAQHSLRNDTAVQTARMSDKSLEILVESGARSANLHDRSLANAANARLERKGLEMSARQAGDAMRAADLTMNFNLTDFLGIGRPTAAIDHDSMRNMFHWGASPDGSVGARKRDTTERQFFESLEKSSLDPDNRPTYGALNVGRVSEGGARTYGSSFFVLRPEVKQRCTFTVDDTFNVPQCKATLAGLDRFETSLKAALPDLSASAGTFFSNQANIDRLRTGFQTLSSFSTTQLESNIHKFIDNAREVTPEDLNLIALLAQQSMIDREATHAQIAGYDNIENLLQHVDDSRLNVMMMGAASPSKGNIRMCNYIEAQVHGRVAFDTDIQALRVSENDVVEAANSSQGKLTTDNVKQKLADFCQHHGIELTYYDELSPEIDAEEAASTAAMEAFERAHADPELMKAQRQETATALEGLLDPSNHSPHGFAGLLSSEARNMNVDVGTLKDEDIDRLRQNIRDKVSARSQQGFHRLEQGHVQGIAVDLMRDLIRPVMQAQQRQETASALDTLLDPSNDSPDGFAGLLSSVSGQMGFDAASLDKSNVLRLKQVITGEVWAKSQKGRGRVEPGQVQSIAMDAMRSIIKTKQQFLATVDGLKLPAQHADLLKKFVLGSTTLASTAMLTALHQTTGSGIALLQSLSGRDPFTDPDQIEAALAKICDFVNDCRAALDVISPPGKPWGRDDLMLFTDRVFSLSASLFSANGGQVDALYTRLVSPEAIALGDALQFDGKSEDTTENTRRNMADALHLMTLMVGREAGHSRPEVETALHHTFGMQSPADLPQPIRQAMTALDLL